MEKGYERLYALSVRKLPALPQCKIYAINNAKTVLREHTVQKLQAFLLTMVMVFRKLGGPDPQYNHVMLHASRVGHIYTSTQRIPVCTRQYRGDEFLSDAPFFGLGLWTQFKLALCACASGCSSTLEPRGGWKLVISDAQLVQRE